MKSFKENIHLQILIFYLVLSKNVEIVSSDSRDNWGFGTHRFDPIEVSYDFIIVGGGNAGCVVASRLSESGKYSVLLIEAGSMPDPNLDVPALLPYFVTTSNYTKVYTSIETNAGLRDAGVTKYVRGSVLGGSSQVNFQYFNRGSPYDFDSWANITGDQSWNYQNLLKYFRRVEDYNGIFPSPTQHGMGGPISVERPSYAPGVKEFLDAGQALGYSVSDPNGPQIVSFVQPEFARRNGRRVSSYTGYIKPYMNIRKNLKVIVDAEVDRIEFEGTRAVGVWYKMSGASEEKFVKCRKEVILSAGVIDSPILLQKSGVGPEQVLKDAGIAVRKALPVGEDLQDHSFIKLDFIINNKSLVFDSERDLTPQNFRLYQLTGQGPYSSTHGYDGIAYFSSKLQMKTDLPQWPDIQIKYLSNSMIPNVFPQVQEYAMAPWEAVVGCGFLGGRPKSRGTLKLNSTDIDGEPLIHFNYFSDDDGYDMDVALDGIRKILEIFEKTAVYKRLGARYPSEPLKGCTQFQFRSDEYFKCYIKHVAGSGLHGSSTCRMGRGEEDKKAVVDNKLRVIGITGLRVVDASIMPQVTNTNLHAAVYGIAEKASDLILQSY